MSPISFSGMASGLDTESIISSMMAVEGNGKVRLQLRQAAAQARQDGWNEVKGKLSALQTAAVALRSAATWGETQTVESSDTTKITARQIAGAAPGGVRLEVGQLARAPQRTYAFTPQAGTSQLTIGSTTVDLTAGATLDDAVAAINASADAGVYAVNVGGQLVLSGKTTGAAATITASGAGLVEDTGKAKAGLDAQFTVDGVPGTASSNVITTAVPGVELTLKAVTAGEVTVTAGAPAPNTAAITEKLKAFVDAYNATVDTVRGKLTEKRVPDASTSADARKGALFGDPALQGILSNLRGQIGAVVSGNPEATDALADLGITTGDATGSATFSADAVAGKLKLDTTKLAATLAADPTAVRRLLGGGGVDGFAQRFEGALTPATQVGGTIEGAATAAGSEVTRLKDAMSRLDSRLASREELLRKQFAALETALSRSKSQQSNLLGALGQA